MGYEILYCSRCQAQLRGRQFESGDAFRIEEQGVCKNCAPEVIKSLPPDKVQILLKQMAVAQGKNSPKTSRTPSAPVPPTEKPEPAGASVADSSGKGNQGTLLNSPSWSPGKMGAP